MVAPMADHKKEMPNFNFAMPPEIAAEFRRIGDKQGKRNKVRWAVAAAAVLKLLELPEEEIYALVQRVIGVRQFPEDLEKMVMEAKAKAAADAEGDEAGDAVEFIRQRQQNAASDARRGKRKPKPA